MKLFVRQENRWESNPIAKILLYVPASIISSLLAIPLTILNLPLLVFNKKIQLLFLKFSFYVQHIVSLSFWYFIIELYFPETMNFPIWIEYPLCLLFVYIGFKKTIEGLVFESIEKQKSIMNYKN